MGKVGTIIDIDPWDYDNVIIKIGNQLVDDIYMHQLEHQKEANNYIDGF